MKTIIRDETKVVITAPGGAALRPTVSSSSGLAIVPVVNVISMMETRPASSSVIQASYATVPIGDTERLVCSVKRTTLPVVGRQVGGLARIVGKHSGPAWDAILDEIARVREAADS